MRVKYFDNFVHMNSTAKCEVVHVSLPLETKSSCEFQVSRPCENPYYKELYVVWLVLIWIPQGFEMIPRSSELCRGDDERANVRINN